MAKLRFAILKEIESTGETQIAKLNGGEYLEYDEKTLTIRFSEEARRVAAIGGFGKKKMLKGDKTFTVDEIAAIVAVAFDRIVNELKKQTIRIS